MVRDSHKESTEFQLPVYEILNLEIWYDIRSMMNEFNHISNALDLESPLVHKEYGFHQTEFKASTGLRYPGIPLVMDPVRLTLIDYEDRCSLEFTGQSVHLPHPNTAMKRIQIIR